MPHNFLAIDLGAESGRAILAAFDHEQLSLTEVHRFPNGPVRLPDGLHWDILRLWSEIKTALHESTAGAGQAGVFGVPTFVVHTPERGPLLYWGADRLRLAAAAAAGDASAM